MKQIEKVQANHYSPNLVYVLSINNKYYVGAHTVQRDYITEKELLYGSGNPLNLARTSGCLSKDDYLSRVTIVRVEECKSREEALDLEVKMIKEYKDLYGKLCINVELRGNRHNNIKVKPLTPKKKKPFKGWKKSEETKRKMSEAAAWRCKKVMDMETGLIYRSKAECAKALGISSAQLNNSMHTKNGKYKQRIKLIA